EADFRFDLVRYRENVEPIAFAKGESMVRADARESFRGIVANWWQLIRAQRNLTLLTTGIGEVNGIVPLLVAAPAYFTGALTLGGVAQTRIAYAQVSGALAWVVNAYQEIARWRAHIDRLTSLDESMQRTEEELAAAHRVQVGSGPARDIRIRDLRLERS